MALRVRYAEVMDRDLAQANLAADISRISDLARGDLRVAVPSCPGWDLARLVGHIGRVQRMALSVISTGALEPAPGSSLESPPNDADALRAYFSSSSEQLLSDLRSTPPDAPSWNFLGQPQTASFWSRRMAHEHAVHRYDAELAANDTNPIPTHVAIDGIDEYFLIANVRVLAKKPEFSLGGSLHLHATDGHGEWMLRTHSVNDASQILVELGHGKGDAAIRGTASDLLLGLWGRVALSDSSRFEHFGDANVVSAIASLGGN
jgi:uncharacterized protein (TIGR03083 family)